MFSKLALVSFVLVAVAAARGCTAEDQFPGDKPMPAFTLPDPLVTASGMAVTSPQQWTTSRRPELLELFRTHVYGRVPATSYEKSFEVTHEDAKAMNGAARSEERRVGE